jgi:ribonuclease HI
MDVDVSLVEENTWRLYFDGSVCSQGQGIRCFVVSPHGVEYELAIHLNFGCTNNQAEYEALLSGLGVLIKIRVQEVEVFGDSKLVIQQVNQES